MTVERVPSNRYANSDRATRETQEQERLMQSAVLRRRVSETGDRREVTIVTEQNGSYGMTVYSQAPVMVDSVRPDGPAHKAGLRIGDLLLSVNEVDVSMLDHKLVVDKIKELKEVRLLVASGTPEEREAVEQRAAVNRSSLVPETPRPVISEPTPSREASSVAREEKARNLRLALNQLEADLERTQSNRIGDSDERTDKVNKLMKLIEKLRIDLAQCEPDSGVVTHPASRSSTRRHNGSSRDHSEEKQREGDDLINSKTATELAHVIHHAMSHRSHFGSHKSKHSNMKPAKSESSLVAASQQLAAYDEVPLPESAGSMQDIRDDTPRNRKRPSTAPNRSQSFQNVITQLDVLMKPAEQPTDHFQYPERPPEVIAPPYSSAPQPGGDFISAILPAETYSDDEFDVNECYQSIEKLYPNKPQLVVFLHHVFDQDRPRPTLFYLLCCTYRQKCTSRTDLVFRKRWLHEMVSTFLHVDSPLKVPLHDEEPRLKEMMNVMHNGHDDHLLNALTAAQSYAETKVNQELKDFRSSLESGVFSVKDQDSETILNVTSTSKKKIESGFVERCITTLIERLVREVRQHTPTVPGDTRRDQLPELYRKQAKLSALLTIAQDLEVKVNNSDQRPLFFNSTKRNTKKEKTQSHSFIHPETPANGKASRCVVCDAILAGPTPQGLNCKNCHKVSVHAVYCQSLLTSSERCQNTHRSKAGFPSFRNPTTAETNRLSRPLHPSASEPVEITSPSLRNSVGGGPFQEEPPDTPTPEAEKVVSSMFPGRSTLQRATSDKKPPDTRRLSTRRNGKENPRFSSDPNPGQEIIHSQLNQTMSTSTTPEAASSSNSSFVADSFDQPVTMEKDRCQSDAETKYHHQVMEFINTELNHITELKLLDSLYRTKLLESRLVDDSLVHEIFGNVPDLIRRHTEFYQNMRAKWDAGIPVVSFSEVLLMQYADEEFVKQLCRLAAKFKTPLVPAPGRREVDLKLFLDQQALNPQSKRQNLGSHMAAAFQRPARYDLLTNTLAKSPYPAEAERHNLEQAVEAAKALAQRVDLAVFEEDLDREMHGYRARINGTRDFCLPMSEFQNFEQAKLVHHGAIRTNLGEVDIQVQALLLDNYRLYLFQSVDNRLILKDLPLAIYMAGGASNPAVIDITEKLELKPNAAKKTEFFVVDKSTRAGISMYRFITASEVDAETWSNYFIYAQRMKKQQDSPRCLPRKDLTATKQKLQQQATATAAAAAATAATPFIAVPLVLTEPEVPQSVVLPVQIDDDQDDYMDPNLEKQLPRLNVYQVDILDEYQKIVAARAAVEGVSDLHCVADILQTRLADGEDLNADELKLIATQKLLSQMRLAHKQLVHLLDNDTRIHKETAKKISEICDSQSTQLSSLIRLPDRSTPPTGSAFPHDYDEIEEFSVCTPPPTRHPDPRLIVTPAYHSMSKSPRSPVDNSNDSERVSTASEEENYAPLSSFCSNSRPATDVFTFPDGEERCEESCGDGAPLELATAVPTS